MKYNIRGNKIDVTEAIEEYIKSKLSKVEKYFNDTAEVKAIISTKGKDQKVEVTIWSGKYNVRAEEVNQDLYAAIDLVLDKTGIRPELKSERTLEADIRLENLEEFKSITRTVEEVDGIASLGDFLDEISLVTDASEKQEDGGEKVTLMTMHAVKGLEFDYVFVIGVEEGLFPHNMSLMENDIEEERRLCYVAITRAKKSLTILNAKRRLLYGDDNFNPPSRFINEIDPEYLDKEEIVIGKPKLKINRANIDEDIEYSLGEHVKHEKYGEGVIIGIESSILTIAFPHPHGIVKIMKGHKCITKIKND